MKNSKLVKLVALASLAACSQEYTILAMVDPHKNDQGCKDTDSECIEPNPDGSFTVKRRFKVNVEGSPADIIFAIDNSGSMKEEQAMVRNSINTFFSKYAELKFDYRVAVMTTDMLTEALEPGHWGFNNPTGAPYHFYNNGGAGTFLWRVADRSVNTNTPKWVSASMGTAAAKEALTNNLSLTTNGSGDEAGLASVAMALGTNRMGLDGYNAGFFRPEAKKTIISVSDEDETRTTNPDLPGFNVEPRLANHYLREDAADFEARRRWVGDILRSHVNPARPDLLKVHSVSGLEGDSNCTLGSAGGIPGYGTFAKAITDDFNGTRISLCQTDFSDDLGQLGINGATESERTFLMIPSPPDINQIRVYINSVEIERSESQGFITPGANIVKLRGTLPIVYNIEIQWVIPAP